MCGEKWASLKQASGVKGSPPRVRGKERAFACCTEQLGITPACAGKRKLLICQSIQPWDHPRLCGEKALMPENRLVMQGSPPPVRGKGKTYWNLDAEGGITPACAGKSNPAIPAAVPAGDHPRLCGEKTECAKRLPPCEGSPPPVRGKAFYGVFEGLVGGITPACAGKRTYKLRRRSRVIGSPPPVRGKD